MKRLAVVAFTLAAVGCDNATEPTMAEVVGTYEAVEFTAAADGDTTDQLARGATLEITLADDGSTVGSLFVPGGAEDGGDFQADLAGSWALDAGTVTFEQDADTFIRGRRRRYEDQGAEDDNRGHPEDLSTEYRQPPYGHHASLLMAVSPLVARGSPGLSRPGLPPRRDDGSLRSLR